MKRNKKGYSLLVLIIAVIVILIITTGVITTINISMEEKQINNFIYDLNNIEATAKQYYSNTGLIPNKGEVSVPPEFGSQLDANDGQIYYELDLSKLNVVNVHNPERTYLINKDSLRVYTTSGIEYKGETYYAVTDTLMGVNTKYEEQDIDVEFTFSPKTWAKRVDIKLTVPNKSKAEVDDWVLKWSSGPKNLDYFRVEGKLFDYLDNLPVYTNGVYSIYINNGETETVKNVVIKNIDDIYPKYDITNGNITIMDDETGIEVVKYKLRSEYERNKSKFEAEREPLDYYLLGGEGKLIESIKTDILEYQNKINDLNGEETILNQEFEALSDEEKELQRNNYEASIKDIGARLDALNVEYAHILDDDIEYVVFFKDYAGNGTVIVDEILTLRKVRETFNI